MPVTHDTVLRDMATSMRSVYGGAAGTLTAVERRNPSALPWTREDFDGITADMRQAQSEREYRASLERMVLAANPHDTIVFDEAAAGAPFAHLFNTTAQYGADRLTYMGTPLGTFAAARPRYQGVAYSFDPDEIKPTKPPEEDYYDFDHSADG